MNQVIKRLEAMLEWSDRLGSDERFEILQIIKIAKKNDTK